ncbi:MAG: hypothetical protein WCI05_01525 [Myxococcales bacterium]|jgi:hypothetical protein
MANRRDVLRTQISIQLADFASTFNQSVARFRFQPGDYAVELMVPEGPSTGGGVQALQHLRLVSTQPNFPAIVIGAANRSAGIAELRSFQHVDIVHRERFKRPFPLEKAPYDQFIDVARTLFGAAQLKVTVTDSPPPEPPPAAAVVTAHSSSSTMILIVGIAIAVVLVAAVAVWLFFIKKGG